MTLQGKIALVTGAGRGIGKACALELARAGADVIVNDRDGESEAKSVVAAIGAEGRRSLLIPGDVFERGVCEAIVEAAIGEFGRIDLLVSNPACSHRCGFLDYEPGAFERVIAGTLISGFHMSQLVARRMVAQGDGGKIVFIASVQGRLPITGCTAYNAAKAGLSHMARTIAAELLPHRINVNTIDPGWIDTPGEQGTFGREAIAQSAPSMPWGRLGTADEIGKAALFLCSDGSDYITGAELLVDGGLCLRGAGGLGSTGR